MIHAQDRVGRSGVPRGKGQGSADQFSGGVPISPHGSISQFRSLGLGCRGLSFVSRRLPAGPCPVAAQERPLSLESVLGRALYPVPFPADDFARDFPSCATPSPRGLNLECWDRTLVVTSHLLPLRGPRPKLLYERLGPFRFFIEGVFADRPTGYVGLPNVVSGPPYLVLWSPSITVQLIHPEPL